MNIQWFSLIFSLSTASFASAVFGSTAGLLVLALLSHDWICAASILAANVVVFVSATQTTLRSPLRFFRNAAAAVTAQAILSVVVVNLRWEVWMPVYRQSRFYDRGVDWPLWTINASLAAIFGVLVVAFFVADRRRQGLFRNGTPPGRD